MKALSFTKKIIPAALVLLMICSAVFSGCDGSRFPGVESAFNSDNPGEITYYETPEENIVKDDDGLTYANNEILLTASDKASYEDIRALAEKYGAEIKGYIEVIGDYQLVLKEAKTEKELNEIISELEQSELVEEASLNLFTPVSAADDATNDERWRGKWDENVPDGENWGVEAIRCPRAWRLYNALNKIPVNVGAVDMGFFEEHSDLNFAGVFHNEHTPDNKKYHGTHVCGTIGAVYNNDRGIAGVYPSADGHLYVSSYSGLRNTDTSNQNEFLASIACDKVLFTELIVRNVKVINYSMGYFDELVYAQEVNAHGEREIYQRIADELERFFLRLLDKGYDFLIVQAAGNSSGLSYAEDNSKPFGYRITGYDESVRLPAIYSSEFGRMTDSKMIERVIIVGNAQHEKGWFSSSVTYKRNSRSCVGDRVDLMAPGTAIYSTSDGVDKYENMDGTSMAAPHVSGTAAMVWSVNNNFSAAEVKRILLDSATIPVEDSSVNMLNAATAVQLAATRSNQSVPAEAKKKGTLITGGYYRDEDGDNHTIPGCHIKIYRAGTDELLEEHDTGEDEIYEFILDPGSYDVVCEAAGYETGKEENIKVTEGQVDYAAVYMKEAVTSFSIPDSLTVTVGHRALITPEIEPEGASASINWSSSDTSVVSVNPTGEHGTVTGLKKGTATVTAELTGSGNTITKTTEVRVASQGRDTVLVLDVSGSMLGKPLTELKKSAQKFCDDLLLDEFNNRVAVVCFNNKVSFHDFSSDLDELKSYISFINSSGSTNMSSGLLKAKELMDGSGSPDHIKNIVIMADGLPNLGTTSSSGSAGILGSNSSYANGVVDTAQEIMKDYKMYSLGFFHSVSGQTYSDCVALMSKLTNMEKGYHEVTNAESLQFEFGDIATEITDGSKIIINIACPVDVSVSYGGETLSSTSNDFNSETSFGKLELLGNNNEVKVLSLDSDKEYDIDIRGTGEGKMDYLVNYMNQDDEIEDYRNFSSVPINNTTIINTNTDNSTTVNLNVDTDGDGKIDIVYEAEGKGEGHITVDTTETTAPPTTEPVTQPVTVPVPEKQNDNSALIFVIISICVFIAIGLTVTLIAVASSKKNKEPDYEIPLIQPDIPVAKANAGDKKPNKNDGDQGVTAPLNRRDSGAVIEILTGGMKSVRIPIDDGESVILGKNAEICRVPFDESYNTVSRKHCEVVYNGKQGNFYVTDFSKNGTFRSGNIRLGKNQKTCVTGGTLLTLSDEGCIVRLKVSKANNEPG